MKTIDSQLQRTFVEATDEVVPPAPWLETEVINVLRQPSRVRRSRRDGGSAIGEFRPGVRLTASLAALLIALGGVAVLLMSARNHTAPQPGSKPTTVQIPSPSPRDTFIPSPAVRAPNWPAGQVVPAQMAGSWLAQINSQEIDLGGYTYQILDPSRCRPDTGTAWICRSGNVVVNGQAIYFMTDVCNPPSGNAYFGPFGYEKYSYWLAGDSLTLVKTTDTGLRDCGLRLDGTYQRIAAS
jgi:hypothetical protein